jgi:hypothetical protein
VVGGEHRPDASSRSEFHDVDDFVSPAERRLRGQVYPESSAMRRALELSAIRDAQVGRPVPSEVLSQLDPRVRREVELLERERSRRFESQFRTVMRREAQAAAVSAVEAPVIAAGEMLSAPAEGIGEILSEGFHGEEQRFPGVLQRFEAAEQTPFLKPQGNAFIDDRHDDIARVPIVADAFRFDPLIGQGDTNLAMRGRNNYFVDNGANILAARVEPSQDVVTFDKVTKQKVEKLHKAKDELADVDMSAFESGNEAFERGNREGLIRAITDLQSKESMMRDRWNLVSKTHAQVVSDQNHEATLRNGSRGAGLLGSGVDIFDVGPSGAVALADQTRRVNEVKSAVLKRANDLHARRRMLQYRLKRLDASVPPETWVPRKVDRFDEETPGGLLDVVRHVKNPVTDVGGNPFFN